MKSKPTPLVVSALLLLAVVAPWAHAAPPTIYDLGTLGGTSSFGYAINAAGQVAGYSYTTAGNNTQHAFLYTGTPGSGGTMADLGTLGGSYSSGYAINAAGQVAGYSYTTGDSDSHPFLYTGTPGSGGAMADLGSLGGSSFGNGINASGQVAGTYNVTGNGVERAFLYTGTPGSGGAMADLGTLGGSGSNSFGQAINASGQVAGSSDITAGNNTQHAFLYTGTPGSGGAMADLGTLGGSYSSGQAINASGQVAGYSYTTGDSAQHAFLYTGTPGSGGAMADLGSLGGSYAYGQAINASGQVSGYSYTTGDSAEHAFLYTGTPGSGGAMIDLDAWLDANNPTEGAKWTLTDATGLTDAGLITGYGTYDDGPGGLSDGTRAFLLDASALVPEPSSLVLAALGFVGLAVWGYRRRKRPGSEHCGPGSGPDSGQIGNAQVNRVFASLPIFCTIGLLASFAVEKSIASPLYHLTDLGTLGGETSIAYGINASGQIAGAADDSSSNARAFLYSGGVMTDLGTLGGNSAGAFAINDAGQIVGEATDGSGFIRAVLFSGGTKTNLGTPAGTTGAATAVNNSGQIVGYYYPASGEGENERAFLYSGGTYHDLGTLGVTSAVADGINDSGQIVGGYQLAGFSSRAFSYSGGIPTELGTLGGVFSQAYAINNAGQIVGEAYISNGNSHAVLYSGGNKSDLQTLGGTDSAADAINDLGQIVGDSQIANGDDHAFLYSSGTMLDLNQLLDSSGAAWTLEAATAINDNGWIVGEGSVSGGSSTEAFLLTPVPEPSTWVLAILGALIFAGSRALWSQRGERTHATLSCQPALHVKEIQHPCLINQRPFAHPFLFVCGFVLASLLGNTASHAGTPFYFAADTGVYSIDPSNPADGGTPLVSGGVLSGASGLSVDSNGNLLVSDPLNNIIPRYDNQGTLLNLFSDATDLDFPSRSLIGPQNSLFVINGDIFNIDKGNTILQLNGSNGKVANTIGIPNSINDGGEPLIGAITLGPDNNLYAAVQDNGQGSVLRFNGQTGLYIDTLVSQQTFILGKTMTFGPFGFLYVESRNYDGVAELQRFSAGTGKSLGVISNLDLNSMAFGPDGKLYALTPFGQLEQLKIDANGATLESSRDLGSLATQSAYQMKFAPNTPPGQQTAVDLTSAGTGILQRISLLFHNVQAPGVTSLVPVDPATLNGMSGVTLLAAANLSTNALFDGPIMLDFHFDPSQLPNGFSAGDLRLFAYDPITGLQNITSFVNFDSHVVEGSTDALETFAIGVVPEPSTFVLAGIGFLSLLTYLR